MREGGRWMADGVELSSAVHPIGVSFVIEPEKSWLHSPSAINTSRSIDKQSTIYATVERMSGPLERAAGGGGVVAGWGVVQGGSVGGGGRMASLLNCSTTGAHVKHELWIVIEIDVVVAANALGKI